MTVAWQPPHKPPVDLVQPATEPVDPIHVGEPKPPSGGPQQGDSRREDDGRSPETTPPADHGPAPEDSRREFRVDFISLDLIDSDPNQVRSLTDPDSDDIKELRTTIVQQGMINTPEVRRTPDGRYQVVTGGRRCEAARGVESLREIPCRILEGPDDEIQTIYRQLIENLQRRDLNPMEQARAFDRVIGHGMTAKQLAEAIGKSEAFVSERRMLMKLSPEDQTRVEAGDMTFDRARAKLRARKKGAPAFPAREDGGGGHGAGVRAPAGGDDDRAGARAPLPGLLEDGERVYTRFSGGCSPTKIRVIIIGREAEDEVALTQVIQAVADHLERLRRMESQVHGHP